MREDEQPTVTLNKGYSNTRTFDGLRVEKGATLKHLVEAAGLPSPLAAELTLEQTADAMVASLATGEQTEAVQKLAPLLRDIAEHVPWCTTRDLGQ